MPLKAEEVVKAAPANDSKKKSAGVEPVPDLNLGAMRYTGKIPANFPLPVYGSNLLNKSFLHSTAGSPSAALTIETGDAPKKVFDWYHKRMKEDNWTVKVPTEDFRGKMGARSNFDFYCLEGYKRPHSVYIFIVPASSGAGASSGSKTNISWSLRK